MDIRDFTRSVEVIDAHTHILRSEAHGRELYGYFLMRGPMTGMPLDPPCFGTLEEAREIRARTGVVHCNILMFTWSGRYYRDGQLVLPDEGPRRAAADAELRQRIAERVRDNNEWALSAVKANEGLSFFCGIDPVVMDEKTLVAEVEDKTRRGALGVKMVPFDLGIRGGDRRLFPVYDYCQARGIPVLSETAGRPGAPSRPIYFDEALAEFPRLKIIFAHMGHNPEFGKGSDAEVVELANRYEHVFTDVSLRLPEVADGHVTPEEMVSQIRSIGSDRVMYGSNFGFVELLAPDPEPASGGFQMTQTLRSLEVLATLPLTEAERADIAAANFKRVTGLATA